MNLGDWLWKAWKVIRYPLAVAGGVLLDELRKLLG